MSVKINSNAAVFLRVQRQNLQNAGRAMANRIESDAEIRAPYLSGDLRSDGRVEESQSGDTLQFKVVFGDSRVPYARRRHYENRKNPHTKYYLENAAKNIVTKGGIKNFL